MQPSEPQPGDTGLVELISAIATGHGTQADHDRLVLHLIGRAQAKGATWEQIARVLGFPSGRACKKAAHKLSEQVRQAKAREPDGA